MAHKLIIIAPAEKLSAIVGALEGSARIIEITEIEEAAPPAKKLKRTRNGGARLPTSETRTGKCLLAALKGGRPRTLEALRAHMQDNGFAPQSASSTSSLLVAEGKIARVGEGMYQIVPQPKE